MKKLALMLFPPIEISVENREHLLRCFTYFLWFRYQMEMAQWFIRVTWSSNRLSIGFVLHRQRLCSRLLTYALPNLRLLSKRQHHAS